MVTAHRDSIPDTAIAEMLVPADNTVTQMAHQYERFDDAAAV